MRCPSCAHANRPERRYCAECGTALDVACARCGAVNEAQAKFCGDCGTPLTPTGEKDQLTQSRTPDGPSVVQRPSPVPTSYTPRHLAEKILNSRTAIEGERKQVTVLFADVKGSMDLAEQVDPEDWHRIMDRFFQILSDGVHRFEGTVNQYTGDGIMALFGAPLAHEDHARRACYAALHLSEELRRYGEEIKRTAGLNFSVRIGLNSGEVIVGAIGDDLRMDYTAQGHTVGLAARMEQLAAPGTAYVTEETAHLVEGFFRLRDLGTFTVKGVRIPVRVYELQGMGPLRTRLDVSRARGLSRFVGRDAEAALLERALARVLAGSGQVVGIVGEPGVGKSRLCSEFAERCRARGLEVDAAHAVPHGKWIPFLPVFELLRGFCGILEDDGPEAARRKIAGTLLLRDDTFKDDLPLLFELLGVPDSERPAPRLDAEARQRQFFDVIRRLIHSRMVGGAAVLLLEDLHWIDAASELALERLIAVVPGTRTLLVVNFRAEYHAAWMERPDYQQIALQPLGEAAVSALLEDLLGTDPSLAGLADHLRERTGGNPFFIEEVVQTLVDTGSLTGAKGAYHLDKPVAELAIPVSVQAVLAARIDRLSEREKAVLQTAAVIGRHFTAPVLTRVVDLPCAALEEAVQALIAADFFYPETLYPAPEYVFKHVLTQEVAYHSQLTEARTRIHAAVARALAIVYADKADERAARIAQHWEDAGRALEAARWNARAAGWAATRDRAEALRHWQKVRTLLATVPLDDETTRLGLTARTQILVQSIRLGISAEDATAMFTEGRQLAQRSGDVRALALVCNAYGVVRGLTGEMGEALTCHEEAMRLAERTDDTGLKLVLTATLMYSYLQTDRLRDALALADQALAEPPEDPRLGMDLIGFSPYAFVLMYRGLGLMSVARLDEAAHSLDRALELAVQCGDVELTGLAHGFRALLGEYTGNREGVLEHARRAVEIAEKLGSPLSREQAYGMLGVAHMVHGQWREAVEALEMALAVARETETAQFSETLNRARLAQALMHLGELERAREAAEQAVALARQRQTALFECHAQLVLAQVQLRCGGNSAAAQVEVALARGRMLADTVGATAYQPFFLRVEAELAQRRGDDGARRRQLREAQRLFAAMGALALATQMARDLESAERPANLP